MQCGVYYISLGIFARKLTSDAGMWDWGTGCGVHVLKNYALGKHLILIISICSGEHRVFWESTLNEKRCQEVLVDPITENKDPN